MITQIEIDGFKTFKDFKVELAPFQVIVGPNGSGKSNLFDGLHLLSRLADTDLLSAFQELRGDAGELFTKLPGGGTSKRIRMAVEMLVDRKARDELGKEVDLKYTRLRYELEVVLRSDEYGLERPYITSESLEIIPRDQDSWCREQGLSSQNNWLPQLGDYRAQSTDTIVTFTKAFILTAPTYIDDVDIEQPVPMITLHHEEEQGVSKSFWAEQVQRTVLSSVSDTTFPHAFAARQELRSLRFLHLNPEALRQPSSTKAQRFLSSNGSNLPTTLARMEKEDKFALVDVSRDMANLVPGVVSIRVEQDRPSDKYVIYADMADRRSFSSQVLSDGTLRLLALATLRNDPQFHGVLCLEEPENGVEPLYLAKMAHLLREMATDFKDSEQVNEPLRQVLVTTHSPTFISQPNVIDSLLLAIIPTRVQGKNAPSIRVTRMVPVITSLTEAQAREEEGLDKAVEFYSIDMVKKYLNSNIIEEAQNRLKEARINLSKR